MVRDIRSHTLDIWDMQRDNKVLRVIITTISVVGMVILNMVVGLMGLLAGFSFLIGFSAGNLASLFLLSYRYIYLTDKLQDLMYNIYRKEQQDG